MPQTRWQCLNIPGTGHHRASPRPYLIFLSDLDRLFCHPLNQDPFRFTPMHQDDQGQFSSRSKIVLRSERRRPWQSSSAWHTGTTPGTRSRRPAPPKVRASPGSTGRAITCRLWRRAASPPGTRRFRFEWAYRPASMCRVIAGFPEKAVAQFSSRRAQIIKTTLALADQYEKDRGYAPGQRVLASMGRFANAMTRRAKGPGALDFIALLRGWERASRAAELETPRDIARTISHATPRANALTGVRGDAGAELARKAGRLAPRRELTHAHEHAVMAAGAAGLARAQESRVAASCARAGRCAVRRRPRATTDAATRGCGWRLDGRSG